MRETTGLLGKESSVAKFPQGRSSQPRNGESKDMIPILLSLGAGRLQADGNSASIPTDETSQWRAGRPRNEAGGSVIYFETMNGEIHMHDVVALLEDAPAEHFETGRPLLLRRGQIGTVVMTYDGTAFEVEFAGRDGHA